MDGWSDGARIFHKSSSRDKFFFQIMEEMFQRCESDELLQFVGIARRIWLRRNEVVHGGQFSPPLEVVQRTKAALMEFQAAHAVGCSICVTAR